MAAATQNQSTYNSENPTDPPEVLSCGFSQIPQSPPIQVNMTRAELERFEKALRDPKFRELLRDYAQEVRDPENRAKYEADVVAMEEEQGVRCTFINPTPGFVVKTWVLVSRRQPDLKGRKAFINICYDPRADHHETVSEEPTSAGVKLALPYLQTRPHEEMDKNGTPCICYDIIFHPGSSLLLKEKPRFRNLMVTTAFEAIEKAFGDLLDNVNHKFPRLKFKGSFRPTVIREPISKNSISQLPDPAKIPPALQKPETKLKESKKTPDYHFTYKTTKTDMDARNPNPNRVEDPCRPEFLIVTIILPGTNTSADLELDVLETRLKLDSQLFQLDIPLPYPVYEEDGTAKFDKTSKNLVVTLPVKPGGAPVERLISTDSGIEVDLDEVDKENDEVDTCEEDLDDPIVADLYTLPPYSVNIYEEVMVFKLVVKNVDESSVKKVGLTSGNETGFSLTFSNVGVGMVPRDFKLNMVLVSLEDNVAPYSMDDVEVEVWDSNVIVQVCFPKHGEFKAYKVGNEKDEMVEHPLAQLKYLRVKREQLSKKVDKEFKSTDGDKNEATVEDIVESEFKERHSSGESIDSVLSTSSTSEDVDRSIPVSSGDQGGQQKGILKRCVRRCFSESQAERLGQLMEAEGVKKSVRFNDNVQRQIFRSNASILGQKHKNQKKNLQKMRKRQQAIDRRNSDSDVTNVIESLVSEGFKLSSSFESKFEDLDLDANDSGVASSYEEHHLKNHMDKVKSKKSKRKQQAGSFDTTTGEMVFNMDS